MHGELREGEADTFFVEGLIDRLIEIKVHIPIIGLSIRFQQLTDNLCRKHEFIGTVRPPSTPYYDPLTLLYTGAKPIGQLGTQPVPLQLRFEVCECGDGASHCVDRCNNTIDV